jgi:hypothetical protein
MSLKPMTPLIKPTNKIVDDVSNKEIRTIQFDDVKEPKTVEEFRENLKKYYVCIGDELYNNNRRHIDINQLHSMRDLYPNDFNWNGSDFDYPKGLEITPRIVFKKKFLDFSDDLNRQGIINWNKIYYSWWFGKDNYEIVSYNGDIEEHIYLMERNSNGQQGMMWYEYWNNQNFLVDFHQKTLGEFSGYGRFDKERLMKRGGVQ